MKGLKTDPSKLTINESAIFKPSPPSNRRLLQVHCSFRKSLNPYSLCIMNIIRVSLTCSQSADKRKTSLWSKITVSKLIDLFTKAVSRFVLKLRHLTSRVQDLGNRLACVTDTEDSEEQSRLIFCLLNLCFFVSLVVLAPDKAIQAFSSAEPAYPVISWFQDAIEVLRKLIPL